MPKLALVMLLLSACALVACSKKPQTPEAQIRAAVARIEKAAEARDVGAIVDFVSPRYKDARGNDKQLIASALTMHYMRKGNRHALTVVRDIRLDGGGAADVEVLAALAATPIEGLDALESLRADLIRFQIRFEREGEDWKVLRADWSRAGADDFF